MGLSQSKFQVILLPAQSGKTRKMCELIEDYEEKYNNNIIKIYSDDDENDLNYLNIIICSNNRLLVKQTVSRMNNDVFCDEIKSPNFHYDNEDDHKEYENILNDEFQSVYPWISNGDNEKINDATIADAIRYNKIKMLLCCSNTTRINDYLIPLIYRLNRDYINNRFHKKINIWIDEADISISIWSKYNNILDLDIINNITGISATIDSIYKKYETFRVLPCEVTYNANTYYKLQDCDILTIDVEEKIEPYKYIKKVFKHEKFKSNDLNGTIWFTPGNIDKESHNNIKTFLNRKGFYVALINGDNKEIYPPSTLINARPISINNIDDEEIGQVIKNIYYDNKLFEYPFAITGQLCVGRGITFQYKNFIFNYGIIPYTKNKASLYQCAARVAGNIKEYINNKTLLYMTSKTKKNIIEKENLSINLAKLLYSDNTEYINKNYIKRAERGSRFLFKIFDTFEEVKIFGINKLKHRFINRNSNKAPSILLDSNGDNPSIEYLFNRGWGINNITNVRAIPTKDNKWFVCWNGNVINVVE
jgi:hypothetical protein